MRHRVDDLGWPGLRRDGGVLCGAHLAAEIDEPRRDFAHVDGDPQCDARGGVEDEAHGAPAHGPRRRGRFLAHESLVDQVIDDSADRRGAQCRLARDRRARERGVVANQREHQGAIGLPHALPIDLARHEGTGGSHSSPSAIYAS